MPDEYIVKVARVMKAANWHTYQILTKRAERMQKLLKGKLKFRGGTAAYLVGRERGKPPARSAAH